MKKFICRFPVAALLVTALVGCASIAGKSEYPVNISTKPAGADITITNRANENVFVGKTPTTVTLKAGAGFFKGENYTVAFKKEGYAPFTAPIERGVSGWYVAGNIVFGGLIGWLIVDPATGAMWTLEDLHVDLTATASSSVQNGLHIVTLDEVPASLRPNLVKLN